MEPGLRGGGGTRAQIIIMTKKADINPGTAVTKAVRAAHAAVKGRAAFVLCDREGEAAQPIVEFFNVKPDAELPHVSASWTLNLPLN